MKNETDTAVQNEEKFDSILIKNPRNLLISKAIV